MKFVDDRGIPVHTVTAEQHALDNPTHVLRVWYAHGMLRMQCDNCKWFDDQGYSGNEKPEAHRAPGAMQNIVEALYDLTRRELRALAYECLAISDGPDKAGGEID